VGMGGSSFVDFPRSLQSRSLETGPFFFFFQRSTCVAPTFLFSFHSSYAKFSAGGGLLVLVRLCKYNIGELQQSRRAAETSPPAGDVVQVGIPVLIGRAAATTAV
jgi:hypothetical protein